MNDSRQLQQTIFVGVESSTNYVRDWFQKADTPLDPLIRQLEAVYRQTPCRCCPASRNLLVMARRHVKQKDRRRPASAF